MNSRFFYFTFAVLSATLPPAAGAQTAVLEGTVQEESSSAPIDAATLTLTFAPPIEQNGVLEQVPADRLRPLVVSTTGRGGFVFPGVAAGTYVLTARRVGYAPLETMVNLTPGTHRTRLLLQPISFELAPVQITASSLLQQHLDEVGFLHRRKEGWGKFMDATEIQRWHPFDVVSFFRPIIRGCTMIFIDGMPRALSEITVDDIAGFEYYSRRVRTPAEYANPRADCGSLVVWTWVDH